MRQRACWVKVAKIARHAPKIMRSSWTIMPVLSLYKAHFFLLVLVSLPLASCGGAGADGARVIDLSGGQTIADSSSPRMEVAGDESSRREVSEVPATLGPDMDGDGTLDDTDQCPDVAEDRDGFQDADGCPEPDNDGDGILDVDDKCPNVPETMNGFEDTDGCPDANIDRAKRAFREGATSFAQGDYATARRFFEEAYNLEPRDPVLYNMAMAAEKQGDRVFACRYYRQWRATPHGSTSSMIVPSLETCP
jgi:hypothetical protein